MVVFDEQLNRWLRIASRTRPKTRRLPLRTYAGALSRTLFPLGGMTKPELREFARKHNLAIAESPTRRKALRPRRRLQRFPEALSSSRATTHQICAMVVWLNGPRQAAK